MIKSSLTFWQSHRGVRLSQSSNGLSQTWNKHAEKHLTKVKVDLDLAGWIFLQRWMRKSEEILFAKLGRFSMSQSNGPFHKVVKMTVGWGGPSGERLVNVIIERGRVQGNELVELLLDCWRFPFGICWSIWYLVPFYLLASNGRFAVKLLVVKLYLPQHDFFLSDIIKFKRSRQVGVLQLKHFNQKKNFIQMHFDL